MAQGMVAPNGLSNAYNIFILVLTVVALVIMVLTFLPLGDSTIGLLQFYDNLRGLLPGDLLGPGYPMFIMFAGIGIIGALASLLSSLLIGSPAAPVEEAPRAEPVPTVEQDVAAIKAELAALRQLLETNVSKR